MANNAIALQARAPQSSGLGGIIQQNAQLINMMTQQRAAEAQRAQLQAKMEQEAAVAKQTLEKGKYETNSAKIKLAQDRVSAVGGGLVGLLRDPSDATLAQVAQTFHSVGMDPAEYEGVLAQIKNIPDANDRKRFTLQFIAQSDPARTALKYVMPDVKPEKVGDASVFIDNNANSPTFGQELFRITASPEPVKLNQQVVDNTLYNVNPLTGVAAEAPVGDVNAGLVAGPRSAVRSDTGVVSPYAVSEPNVATQAMPTVPTASSAMTPPAAPLFSQPTPKQRSSVAKALQTNPGAIRDGAFARSQPGYSGSSGGFATFDTPAAGAAAQESLLRSAYVAKGHNTINKIINRYAPPGGENDPAAVENYKKYVSQRTGINMNAPITAAQVPAVASAMREFETGKRPNNAGRAAPSGDNAPATPTTPLTVADANRQKAAKQILPIIGYNQKTGANRVSQLIASSTSGGAEMLGSDVVGFFGKATKGREALGELRAIADNMTFEKLRGKLGAQISDADVRLIANTMADIANGNTPANERLAAWNNVVVPLIERGAGIKINRRTPTSSGASKSRPPLSSFKGR